jgi:hypothetical protein
VKLKNDWEGPSAIIEQSTTHNFSNLRNSLEVHLRLIHDSNLIGANHFFELENHRIMFIKKISQRMHRKIFYLRNHLPSLDHNIRRKGVFQYQKIFCDQDVFLKQRENKKAILRWLNYGFRWWSWWFVT